MCRRVPESRHPHAVTTEGHFRGSFFIAKVVIIIAFTIVSARSNASQRPACYAELLCASRRPPRPAQRPLSITLGAPARLAGPTSGAPAAGRPASHRKVKKFLSGGSV